MPNAAPKTFARPPAPPPPPTGFGRKTVIALGAATLATTLWGGAATWYILCRDDFVQTFLARQAEMRFAYEDKVTDLRNRLEREITSGLVERKGFNARVEALAKRQAEIEARQAWLSSLTERVGGAPTRPGAIADAGTGIRPAGLPVETFPSPAATGSIAPRPPLDTKPTPLPTEPFDLRLPGREGEQAAARVPDRLSAIEDSLGRVSRAAVASTDSLRRRARDRALLIRQALATARIPLPAPAAPMPEAATGGPFIAATKAIDAAAFAPLVAGAEGAVTELERTNAAIGALPLGRPLSGELEQTSGFGYRLDPFNRMAALHSGIDFRAPYGAPVRATAAGRVSVAEPTGGYGNMVEIQHEGGLPTRYGHLSAISVVVGQRVEAGQVVGRAGSTGRSTGNHLHYETRIDGEPVNPARFLEAGRLLAAVQ
ncbi:M23 family metallopeptidase [Enterovirga sp.]|uniref:M23 family metallopeptidase n=1 Tax=Enterovirga sp. TaxID=2026350 RepID=UPI002B556600|nr:M23 family metallopeptidase [Enterovirga sp.]HMO30141.1 M23 family metallopeptidase [Enterovirga sp.]